MSGSSGERPFFRHIKGELRLVFILTAIAVILIGFFTRPDVRNIFEAKFADNSHGGLAIVPASCPSSAHFPSECGASCSCPSGLININGACVGKVVITSAPGAEATWVVPSTWNSSNNSIEVIAGGGGGGSGPYGYGGGGGGAYAKVSNVALSSGSSIHYYVGRGGMGSDAGTGARKGGEPVGYHGEQTYFGNQSNGRTYGWGPYGQINGCTLGYVCAWGGGAAGGQSTVTGAYGAGGQASQSFGTIVYAGGNGYPANTGGGGGAAGPSGAGGNASGATGGAGGAGAGGAGGTSAGAGGNGTEYGGVGSGGGGAGGTNGGYGGYFGGGGGGSAGYYFQGYTGGNAANGLIVITWTPSSAVSCSCPAGQERTNPPSTSCCTPTSIYTCSGNNKVSSCNNVVENCATLGGVCEIDNGSARCTVVSTTGGTCPTGYVLSGGVCVACAPDGTYHCSGNNKLDSCNQVVANCATNGGTCNAVTGSCTVADPLSCSCSGGTTYNGYSCSTSQYITTTGAGTFQVPADWINDTYNSIEVIGGGGGGASAQAGNIEGRGGGGGGYTKATNVTLSPGATVGYSVGAGGGIGSAGGDTFFCSSTANCSLITSSAVVAGAKGGGGGTTVAGGAGGAAASGVPSAATRYSGGTASNVVRSGGGAAAGPGGNGAAPGDGTGSDGGGGGGGGSSGGSTGSNGTLINEGGGGGNNASGSGGGAGGFSSGISGPGAAGTAGGGGGGGGGNPLPGGCNGCTRIIGAGGNGGPGNEWDSTHGPGGGGGASGAAATPTCTGTCTFTGANGGAGGNYGGGGGGAGAVYIASGGTQVVTQGVGGVGAQGIIRLKWGTKSTLTCTCPDGFTWNGSVCTNECVLDGTYTCSDATHRQDNCGAITECNVAAGEQCVGAGSCQCVASGALHCTNGQVLNSCNVVQTDCRATGRVCSAGACVCSGGRVWNGSSCACPAGQVWNGASCVASCTPSYFCSGDDLMREDAFCADTLIQTCSWGCVNGVCNPAPTPDLTLTVLPLLVVRGETVTIDWSAVNVTSCLVTGSNGDNWVGTSSSRTSSAITGQTIYKLQCNALDGSNPFVTKTVNIIPEFCEPGAPSC